MKLSKSFNLGLQWYIGLTTRPLTIRKQCPIKFTQIYANSLTCIWACNKKMLLNIQSEKSGRNFTTSALPPNHHVFMRQVTRKPVTSYDSNPLSQLQISHNCKMADLPLCFHPFTTNFLILVHQQFKHLKISLILPTFLLMRWLISDVAVCWK